MYKLFIQTFLVFFIGLSFTFAAEREIIAKVYGKPIYRDGLKDPQGRDLPSLLTRPLYERFVAENKIVATESEIKEFITAMNFPASSSSEEQAMMHDMAKASVLNWKISKALYKKYGGDVIFQQANPLEPIGAERQFLEEQEKSGALQILNPQERTKFFEYYVRSHGSVIPPSKVDYERPWWLK